MKNRSNMDLIIHLIDAHMPAWKGKKEEQGKPNNLTSFRTIRDISWEINDPYLSTTEAWPSWEVLALQTFAEPF